MDTVLGKNRDERTDGNAQYPVPEDLSELQFGNESDFLDILSDIYENLSAKDLLQPSLEEAFTF